ncbi:MULTISPECIES: GNAT family N-acetyltransferase [Shouchella]|uniref:N-acetyltransferase domain-containing protein n=2 Tax=Shouchella TaxID=2893057 RepID=A0ABY7W874_9BACI|nr:MULTISPECIES: hypothetical protein [Shouchella]MED4128293.1 hypothetical protein [Shouchella miscanthi]WDF05074.1 hypothetical protein PQ477_06295 [Shouchella hunanensis]GAF21505.1 hypothetical protein JCM19047_1189 [Bacillus sp. JCM 19047]
MSLTVRKMEETDVLAVQHLFARVGSAKTPNQIDSFVVVENEEGMLVGTVGLDKVLDLGLLRTLVIDSEKTHAMAAVEFIQLALAFAHSEGVNHVYALSSGKASLFEPLGFEQVSKQSIPEEIKQLEHYQHITSIDDTIAWSYNCSHIV